MIKHNGISEHEENVKTTRLWIMFFTFPLCSEMPAMFYYHSLMTRLRFLYLLTTKEVTCLHLFWINFYSVSDFSCVLLNAVHNIIISVLKNGMQLLPWVIHWFN